MTAAAVVIAQTATPDGIAACVDLWGSLFQPPPDLTIAEWSDANRYLSPESSAMPGRWRTDFFPPQRGIMDAVSDPLVEEVTVMSSSQVGKTEIINNVVGFYIDQDPSPILVQQPTLEIGQTWSKDRLAPMLRDTPCLRGRVRDSRAKNSHSTMLHKSFPGGHLTVCGANSAASLASRPIRILLCDEVDRYPDDVGGEGDPISLAMKRTTTFWNRVVVKTSTPTLKGLSRIENEFERSDKRFFFVPCPRCDEYQRLTWKQIHWPEGRPQDAVYICEHCGAEIEDHEKLGMLRRGEWRATAPFNGAAGFHINELYSVWVSFGKMAKSFLDSKDDPAKLKVWINTSLGETWEEKGDAIESGGLLERREDYGPALPGGAAILTAGVDVQDDCLVVEVVAWGLNLETWSMAYTILPGDTKQAAVWSSLADYLLTPWAYSFRTGVTTRIAAACVDTGGHATQQAYEFCRPRYSQRIWAIKGASDPGKPIFERPSKRNKGKTPLFVIGTDTVKDALFGRLKIVEPGPGYCHFSLDRNPEYFDSLTAEEAVTRYNRGFSRRVYVKKRKRNEALDCRVYATVAYHILNPNMEAVMSRLRGRTLTYRPAPPPSAIASTSAHRPAFRGRRMLSQGVD